MHHPFRILDDWVREGRLRLSEPPHASGGGPLSPAVDLEAADGDSGSDEAVFRTAMAGVREIRWNDASARTRAPCEIPSSDGETGALQLLEEFYRHGSVELEWSREYVEHSVQPIGRLYLDGLRAGRFAVQSHLDLHGLTIDEARQALDAFIRTSARIGHSCVRVIHGRGLHSTGRRPILKEHVVRWLQRRRLARRVIAFTSARVVDGGGGAVYVLLRRD